MKLRGTLYPGEKVLVATRSHPLNLLSVGMQAFIAVVAFSFASAVYNSSAFFGILAYLLALIFSWLALKGLLRWTFRGYFLTNYRLAVQKGVSGRQVASIALENIAGIDASASAWTGPNSASLQVHALGTVHVLRHLPRGREFSQEVYEAQQALLSARYGRSF